MAKRARTIEVPLDQDIDLDVSADDPIIPIVDDTKQELPVVVAPEEPPAPDAGDLRKQLADLQKSEAEARRQMGEAVQREQEANRRNLELQQQTSQHEVAQVNSEYDSILNAINAAETEAGALQQQFEQHASMGDYKAQAETQRKMARAEARLEALEQGKSQIEYRIETIKNAPKREAPPVQHVDPLEAHIAPLPDLAKQWVRKNREYMENADKNVDLQMAHLKAQKAGITSYTQPYIDFIEKELGMRGAVEPPEPEPQRRTPVSAPVSREVASPVTGRSAPTKVTLTAEERQTARDSMPGTDPAEAERIYAQGKLKLQQLKGQGHYQER